MLSICCYIIPFSNANVTSLSALFWNFQARLNKQDILAFTSYIWFDMIRLALSATGIAKYALFTFTFHEEGSYEDALIDTRMRYMSIIVLVFYVVFVSSVSTVLYPFPSCCVLWSLLMGGRF